jgi:hypothetical protein
MKIGIQGAGVFDTGGKFTAIYYESSDTGVKFSAGVNNIWSNLPAVSAMKINKYSFFLSFFLASGNFAAVSLIPLLNKDNNILEPTP